MLALALEIRVVMGMLRGRAGLSTWLLPLVLINASTWPLLALCISWIDLRHASTAGALSTVGALEAGVVLVEATAIALLARLRAATGREGASVGTALALRASLLGNVVSAASVFLIFFFLGPAFASIGW